ncbi:hypothetical protein Tcan_11002 [Toxocara canis]|uniref:Uncharacterized protein n=1 Tax=Toxocara canis TaxID=6265 RepID=A0A0B2VXR5_TOXCA|nr:hypothetical protein Tcan_11002 [Toxocara canis]
MSSKAPRPSRIGKLLSSLVRSMANSTSDVEVAISINFRKDPVENNFKESQARVAKKKRELGRISDMDPSLRSWGNRHFPSNDIGEQHDGPYESVGDIRSGRQLHSCRESSIRRRIKDSPEKLSLGGLLNGGASTTGTSDEDTFPKTEELFPAANITYLRNKS